MLSTKMMYGTRVVTKPGKFFKYGKVAATVFSSDGRRAVGFMIKRPDLLWMFKRSTRFLALDSFDEDEGRIYPTQGKESWDDAAIKRLNLNFDTCIIWEGMDVRTQSGTELGRVDSLEFHAKTGEVGDITVGDGLTSSALVGKLTIPVADYLGYQHGFLVVTDEAGTRALEGGLAQRAGEMSAQASYKIEQAGEKVSQATQKGAHELGRALGKAKRATEDQRSEVMANVEQGSEQAAKMVGKQIKKTKGMFAAFKEEYDKAKK